MKNRYIVLVFLAAISTALHAETIAVIGTGNVGSALGPAFADLGHTIVYGSRHPASDKARNLVAATSGDASVTKSREAVRNADVVVLAVPGLLVEEITLGLGDLSGKIIIDPSNPLVGDWDTEVGLNGEVSNTQIIQKAAPDAFVVKAFSTLNWRQMVEPGGDITISMAGDNEEAKEWVAELIISMGLQPLDLGPAKHARWIEGMAVLWINNRISSRPDFDFHLRRTEAFVPSGIVDSSMETGFSFECTDFGSAAVRFLGPDTVEVQFRGSTYQLPLERSASGAKYSADDVTFWNKGDEALIEVGEDRFSCTRNSS